MNKKTLTLCIALGFTSSAALSAEGIQQENLYLGGGININSVSDFDDAAGFQFFAGYDLDMVDLGEVGMAVEVGYFDSGSFDRTVIVNGQSSNVSNNLSGLWANAVFNYPFNPRASLVGRLGLDFGDDDGVMFGVGVGYSMMKGFDLRGEYVVRENIDSLQANVVYRF